MRAESRVRVIMRCSSEAVKRLWEAMSVVCSTCIYTGAAFFHVFLKFKRGMLVVSSMTTPLRKHMIRIYSVVILVLTIKSLKMKQMVDFFVLQESSGCVLN